MDNGDDLRASELFRAGPRHVLSWRDENGVIRRRLFVNRWDLAIALRALSEPCAAKAWGLNGESLDVRKLVREGRAELSARSGRGFTFGLGVWEWMGSPSVRAGHQTRWGPVPNLHAHRGGGGWMRRMRTQHEITWAQSVDPEEPAPRAKRCGGVLPNAWDDYHIQREKGWKRQGKGPKAWARKGSEPSGDRRALARLDWETPNEGEESER